MTSFKHELCASAIALATVLAAAPASAQNTAPAASAANEDIGLADIVVTAQKRSENLQDVPIAVVAITSAKLASSRTMTSQDLQFSVPSLVYNQLSSFAQPYLRGIGSDITQPNADPSVATYIDGVFVSFNAGTITNLLGVERVEVLEGPQGTLFGRNAVGGAISIYTLTPKQELEAKVTATYGNYNRMEGSGYISGGITDNLAVGLYVGGTRRDSFLHRIRPAGVGPYAEEPKHETNIGGRIKAVWTPTENFTLTGSAEVAKTRSFEQGAFRNIQFPALAYTLGAPVIIGKYTAPSDLAQFNNTLTHAFMLREELDLGFARLLGISSYRTLGDQGSDDIDATTLPILASRSRVPGGGYGARSKQGAQELQLLSEPGSKISWIVGAYFFKEKSGFTPNTADGIAIQGAIAAATGGAITNAYSQQNYGNVRTTSYAAFAQATAPLGAAFRLTVGGRITKDTKKYLGGVNRIVDINNNPVLPDTLFAPDSHSWKRFTPKVTLDYKIGGTLLYATYSKGFKAGVYNVAAPGDLGPVNPEDLTNYEVGVKSELFDRRLRINTSGFYYDYKNVQVQKVLLGSGGSTSLQNAASARLYGLESSLTAAATRDLTLTASVAIEHATYRAFDNPASFVPGPAGNAPFPPSSAAGNDLPRAPKLVFNLGADYKHELAGGGSIDGSLNYYYNDGFYWESTNRYRQNHYNLLNASVGYTFPGDRYSIRAFGTNLTNQYYSSAFILLPVSIAVQDAPPRMYGVSVTAKF